MWSTLKKYLVKILLAVTGTGIALAAPIIPVEMEWVRSYETVAFDTVDGDLNVGEYATYGDYFYYRDIPKNKGATKTTDVEPVGMKPVDVVARKSETNLNCLGCMYYTEFHKRNGELVRVPESQTFYKGLEKTMGAPQPKKTERVSIVSPEVTGAAITFATTTDTDYSGNSSTSFSYTTGGSDRGLVVVGSFEDTGDSDRDITALTYNSVSMTEGVRHNDDAQNVTVEIWYLAAPATGSNTLAVTTNGAVFSANINVSYYNGVHQTTMLDATTTAQDLNTTNLSYSLTTVADNSMIIDAAILDFGSGFSCSPIGEYNNVSWDTAGDGADAPTGMVLYQDELYITDDTDDDVYIFNTTGTLQTQWDIGADSVGNASGITQQGGLLYISDWGDDEVYIFNTTGTLQTNWDISSESGVAEGISSDETFLWVLDRSAAEVYKYNTSGTYQSISWDTAAAGASNAWGSTWDGTYFYISDTLDDAVYLFDSSGTYTNLSFDIGQWSGDAEGLAATSTSGVLFAVDSGDDEVYEFKLTGQTEFNDSGVNGTNAHSCIGYLDVPSAGSTVVDWACGAGLGCTTSRDWTAAAMSIAPAAEAAERRFMNIF